MKRLLSLLLCVAMLFGVLPVQDLNVMAATGYSVSYDKNAKEEEITSGSIPAGTVGLQTGAVYEVLAPQGDFMKQVDGIAYYFGGYKDTEFSGYYSTTESAEHLKDYFSLITQEITSKITSHIVLHEDTILRDIMGQGLELTAGTQITAYKQAGTYNAETQGIDWADELKPIATLTLTEDMWAEGASGTAASAEKNNNYCSRWNRKRSSQEKILKTVLEQFDVSEEEASADILEFLEQMRSAHLLNENE